MICVFSFSSLNSAEEYDESYDTWIYDDPDNDYTYDEDTDNEESDDEDSDDEESDDEDSDGEESDDENSEEYSGEEIDPDSFDVDENSRQREELKGENSGIREKIKLTKNEIKEKTAYSKELQKEISQLSTDIKKSNKTIKTLNSDIIDRQKKIDAKLEEIKDILDMLRVRLRKIHTAGDTSSLEIILRAKSFSDFIDKTEMIKSVSEYDNRLITSIQGQLEVISEDQKMLRENKQKVEDEKVRLESNKKKINKLFDENEKLIVELKSSQQDLESQKKENEEKQKELKKALDEYKRLQAEREGKQYVVPPDPDGKFVWPCPGYTYLTSLFEEWRGITNHGAIDIAEAGIYGAKVVACKEGYVVSTNDTCPHDYGKESNCGCGNGYGNFVMIDHGDGRESIYAHLCELAVEVGDHVEAGQLIGYVGSTGYSTGAHLHFETRYNGERYNPLTEY